MVWQTGQRLQGGKFEIIEILGQGGFGITYKARNRVLDIDVVIKTPNTLQRRDSEYDQYIQQFQEEGRKLARFSANPHPHIVRILDIFLEDQFPCLVMDFIQGQTLMEKVKNQGSLSESECLKYIRQVGDALATVHQAGFVHRDAHPGNIMIQPNGKAVLIDFGIAKNIIPATRSSTNNAANLSFAPYEQIYKGSNASREPNVDVYSLAATFYYVITGKFPTPSMERRLDNRPLIPPQQLNRQLSGHINDAIVLGMALEKENRPQSMLAWLQQLDLSPPAVSIQYQKEIINPSQVFPKTTRKPPQSFLPKQKKKFPWGWLIALFVFYSLIGLSLALGFSLEAYRAIWTASFWSMSLVLGIASALFFTITAGTRTPNGPNEPFVDSSWLIPCLIFFFPFMFWGMSSNYWLGRIYIYLVMIPLAFMMSTWIQAMQRLLAENFRPSHRFLIIATTNFGGLGFGLLLGLLMRR